MKLKLICLLGAAVFFLGCVQTNPTVISTPGPPYTYNPLVEAAPGSNPNATLNPFDISEGALPQLSDLPTTPITNRAGPARKYTGIIRNQTCYEVTVPSNNSGASLIIPARSWVEYVAYERHFNLTAFHGGKPFYCMNINAEPRSYAFMCDRYDFMVDIVKPEPKHRVSPKKMKRYKKKPKCDEEANVG